MAPLAKQGVLFFGVFVDKNWCFVENILYIGINVLFLWLIMKNMNKTIIYCLLALAATACSKSNFDSNTPSDKIEVSFGQTATIQSRTTVGQDGHSASWSGDETIALWAANGEGNYELSAQAFKMHRFSQSFTTAIFSATITPLTEQSYTYYATHPAPNSVSGDIATFTLPAVQDGGNNFGSRDIMVARPTVAPALNAESVVNLNLGFSHKMHALRIVLPQNTLQDKPITHMEMEFEQAVVGDVLVNFADPDAGTTLVNGISKLTINIPEGYKAGDYLWAMIHPTDLTGEIVYRVYAGEHASVDKAIPMSKVAEASHISPMQIAVPEPNLLTTIYLDVTANNLGEDYTSLTVLDSNGNTIKSFKANESNSYSWSLNGQIDESKYNNQTFTIRYESQNAIVEDKVVFSNFTPYEENNRYTTKVPYLLFEDFSGIFAEGESYGNNDYASDDRNQPGESLDSIMDPDGWNAARYWAPHSCVRINARSQATKIVMLFASQHHGRLDTPQLKGLKSTANVNLKLLVDAGAHIHKSSSFPVSGAMLCVVTHTNANNPIDGIPVGATGITSKYDTTLDDFGQVHKSFNLDTSFGDNAFGSTFPTQECVVYSATSANRICFYPIVDCDNNSTGNAEANVYIDNIRVSIAK